MRFPSRLRRWWPWVVGGALVAIPLAMWLAADRAATIALRAAGALQSRDAETLLSLASPDEVSTLGLTTANVRAALNETLWRTPGPNRIVVTASPVVHGNLRGFILTPDPDPRGDLRWRRVMQIWVVRLKPRDRWSLRLTWTLREAGNVRPPVGVREGEEFQFGPFAQKLGILGLYDNAYDKVIWSTGRWSRIE